MTSRTDRVIRTPGKTPTFVSPRDDGGWVLTQGKNGRNKIRLADDEALLIAEIFTEEQ
jgi:hypothetical protein